MLIPLLVFNSLWGEKRNGAYIIIGLIVSVLATIYLVLIRFNIWEIFLLIIPAVAIVLLSFNVKKQRPKTENATLEGVE